MIGKQLTQLLVRNGFQVHILTRSPNSKENTSQITFHGWDPMRGELDGTNIPDVNVIINLAGSPIIGKRWNDSYKNEIIRSRVKSAQTLAKFAAQLSDKPLYLGASAIGMYGDSGETKVDETHQGNTDRFIVKSVIEWEKAHLAVQEFFKRTVIFRIGLVLSSKGGMLEKLMLPAKFGIYSYLGNGQQWQSWIHIEDLCSMFLFAIQNDKVSGIYNAVGPVPVRANQWMRTMKAVKNANGLVMPTPLLPLKIAFGEAYKILIDSSNVSSAKIESSGFKFAFKTLESALGDLLK